MPIAYSYVNILPPRVVVRRLEMLIGTDTADGRRPSSFHLTVVPPFCFEEPEPNPEQGPHQPAGQIIGLVNAAKEGVEPLTFEVIGLRVHPNASETSFVVSLRLKPALRFLMLQEQLRKSCKPLTDCLNTFPPHITLVKEVSSKQAAQRLRKRLRRKLSLPICFECSELITWHRSAPTDPWELKMYHRLAAT